MSAPLDTLEQQLQALRPARLTGEARQRILQEMERPVAGHASMFWLFVHRTGFQAALAGALSLALVMGWCWLPRSLPQASRLHQTALVASSLLLPSQAVWETELAAASPVGINTVTVLRSPSILTNTQIRR